jgi:8-oxo-dGTP pyrophosphatase MutT (NUDIX family)
MNFQQVVQAISYELQQPLPGEPAQLLMASMRRVKEMFADISTARTIKSSVLILVYPDFDEKEPCIVLIQRPDYDGVHGGQISLPGGKFEEHDGSLAETAIRESEEEIGIDGQTVKIIGQLSELYIPPSNYIVFPFVGFTSSHPVFIPDQQEVVDIIEIRLKDLSNENNVKYRDIFIRDGLIVHAPCFDLAGKTVWGATAMILSEFKEILKRIQR